MLVLATNTSQLSCHVFFSDKKVIMKYNLYIHSAIFPTQQIHDMIMQLQCWASLAKFDNHLLDQEEFISIIQ